MLRRELGTFRRQLRLLRIVTTSSKTLVALRLVAAVAAAEVALTRNALQTAVVRLSVGLPMAWLQAYLASNAKSQLPV